MQILKKIITIIKDKGLNLVLPFLSEKKKFSLIYKTKFWKYKIGSNFSASGAGSDLEATINIRAGLELFFKKFSVKSILDIPCGDFYWMSKLNLDKYKYLGCDLVEQVITDNNLKYKNFKNVSFSQFDLINDDINIYNNFDFLVIRDCLVHLEESQIRKILNKIFKSKIKFIALTSYEIKDNNISPQKGDRWRPINFLIEPYNLKKPFFKLNDQNELNSAENKKLLIWKTDENSNIYTE